MADYSLYNTRTNPNNLCERDRVVGMAMADLRQQMKDEKTKKENFAVGDDRSDEI